MQLWFYNWCQSDEIFQILWLFLDVCYLRLDFEIFTIEGPTTTSTEIGGGICTDSFSVSVRLQLEFIQSPMFCQHI